VPECMIPFVPILEKGEEPFAMLRDLWIKYREWVLDPIRYPSVDRSTLRQVAGAKGIKTCIPARSNRSTTVPFSATAYRRRHRVENFFQRIKRYRRVAARYDKLAETFLGFVCLAILFTLRLHR